MRQAGKRRTLYSLLLLVVILATELSLCVASEKEELFRMKGKEVVVSTVKQEIWIRSGPGFSYPVIGKVTHCSELKVLEKGIWYRVQEGALTGYVYGSTFNTTDEYIPGRLKGIIIGLDPDGQMVMDLSEEPLNMWGNATNPKMDERVFGVNSQTPDYEINLKVVEILKRILELEGARVVVTKDNPETNLSNAQRARLLCGTGEESSVACYLILRISCNQADTEDTRGVTAHFQKNTYKVYEDFAQSVVSNISKATGMPSIAVSKEEQNTFLNWCTMPAISVEIGHLTNTLDEKILLDQQYQTAIADGIRDAVVDHYVNAVD